MIVFVLLHDFIQPLDFVNSFAHQMKAENVRGPSSLSDMKTEKEVASGRRWSVTVNSWL